MTIPSEQLEAIFQEIKANFAQHQQIQVTPIAGSPPEQYRITYYLQGFCKKDGGEIQICTNHIVTLTLPFGFPHFPPNCKPESPIFHPDFDEAAICIGEFWEAHPSLPGLILHIGRMLCGEIYSTENAFNDEAAIWYNENKNRFPLDTIEQFSPSTSPIPTSEQPRHVSEPLIMDSIDDDLFASNETEEGYDITTYEPTEQPFAEIAAPKPPPPQPSTDPTHPTETDTLIDSEGQHNLKTARRKHQEGESFEHKGQPAKALERFKEVMALFPDFPGIEKDISRAQYSLEMLGDLITGDAPEADKGQTTSKAKGKQATPAPNNTAPVRQETHQKSRGLAIAIGGGSVFLLLSLIFTYMFFNTQLKNAQTMFTECQQLLDTGQLTSAEKKCSDALELTYKVLFFKQQEKKLLAEEIKKFQGDEKLKDGLELSPKGDTDNQPTWQQSMQFADKNMADGKWNEALKGYTHTLQLAAETATVDRPILEQVRANIAIAQVNISLQAGEQAMAGLELDSAKNHFDKAMQLANQNPQIPTDIISRIKSLAGQVEFNKSMASGEKYFSQEDWQNALSSFEKAQEIERNFSFAVDSTRATLHEMIIKTKVFKSLTEGKKAFADAQWDQAIKQYETAVQLLEENSEILRRDNPQQSQQKIARLMLHAAVIRDKQKVASHLKNKEFTQAIDKLHTIIETINLSTFAKEQEFQTIIKETNTSLNQAQDDRLVAEQSAYLTDNYQKLFIQNNPSLVAENLSSPRVTFLKKIGNKMLYKLQCFEQGHGRPVLRQASYIYDPANKKWSLFSNDNSESEQKTEIISQDILSSAYKSQENLLISEQIAYLTDNFQTIFTQNFPDLLRDDLSKPQATFLKKINGKLIFMLQCLNHGSGSEQPTIIKANYIYDPATHHWDFSPIKENA